MLSGKPQASFSAKSVLIVDPADNIRATIASMLKQLGFVHIQQAAKLSHANEILGKKPVDIIICEQHPPEVDGLGLLRRVRNSDNMANCAFVMISASLDQSTVVNAVKSGISEFIVKPFSLKTFSERLQRAIALPIKHQNAAVKTAHHTQTEPENLETTSILVVDDVPDNIKVVTEVIRHDYQVKAATSGEKALKICLSDSPPDVVLLDIMMPDMDGLTVCKKLKSHPATQHITVIFISAMDQTDDVVRGLELGAVDYITKPINPKILAARVKNHVRIARAAKNLREQVDLMVDYTQLRAEFDRALQKDMKRPFQEISDNLRKLDVYYDEPKKVKETTQHLRAICSTANAYVDNLNIVTRLENKAHQLNAMNLNLVDMVKQITEQLSELLRSKSQKWQIDDDALLIIQAEDAMVRMTLMNIIKNAIEASDAGATINISFQNTPKSVVCLVNNPAVVATPMQERFFEKYATWNKPGGTGLGTYVAKLLTEAQGGVIRFDSTAEAGTTVYLEYPKK